MIRNFRYRNHGLKRGSTCEKSEFEDVVREGLAYTPSDMARLTERGMPVNGLNTQQAFLDGEENPSFHITRDRQRHVDICDLWEEHVTLRDKARKAAKVKKLKSK